MPILNKDDIDLEVTKLTIVVNEAMENFIPKQKYYTNSDVPPDIVNLIDENNPMRERHFREKDTTLKETLKAEITSAAKINQGQNRSP